MEKTVKEYKDWLDTYENPTESKQEPINSFKDILDEIFANYEKELNEKDKEINFYKQQLELAYTLFINKNLRKELDEKQLYKENFDSWYQCDECKTLYDDNYCPSCMEWIDINEYTYVLKDNSKYEKLESKEEQE